PANSGSAKKTDAFPAASIFHSCARNGSVRMIEPSSWNTRSFGNPFGLRLANGSTAPVLGDTRQTKAPRGFGGKLGAATVSGASGPSLRPVSAAPAGSGTVATVTKVPACGSIFWIAPEKFEANRLPSSSEVIDSGSWTSAGSKLTTTVGCWGVPGGAAATK